MTLKRIHRWNCYRLLTLVAFLSSPAWSQGFLEMPDTTEVPEYERDSMLLDLDVPAVRDRDPDPEAGPRLNIKEFRVQGIVEFPSLGITREAIIKQVESIRFDLMKEDLHTESGFTLDELGEISNLVIDIEKSTKTQHVGPLEVQKFVFLIRDQLRRRGVTLGMIETVADTITQFYRERGFILAKAYIPKQKVRDGAVTLTLLLGELSDVVIEDNTRVFPSLIQSAFKNDLYKPVANWKVDEALTLINDIPGLRAQGFFSPGDQVGDTRMTVKLLEEKWTTVNLRLDNHGSKNTSENRAYADIYVHNPLGFGDEVYVGVLNSYNPDSSTYGSIRYNAFIANPRLRGSVGFSTNDFVSRNLRQVGALFFTGKSDVADVSLRYIFKRSRVKNYSVELKFMDINTELDTQAVLTEENVDKTSLSFNFDILNEKQRQLYLGNITFHQASTYEAGGLNGTQVGNESFLSYDLSMLSFLKVPFTASESRILWRSSGQYAGKALSNLNQINLTGPSRTRGFGVNGFQSDDGIYVGADWIFTLPTFGGKTLFGESINRVFQPYVFVDAAYGILPPLTDGDKNITGALANVGGGLKVRHSRFTGSVAYSTILADDVNDLQDATPASSVYFEVQVTF
jgi:hemolysin activation/secretion protein